MSKSDKPPGKPPAAKPGKPPSDTDKLKEEILADLKPKLQKSFTTLKTDLLADIKELIVKTHTPNTEKTAPAPAAPDMAGVQNILKSVLGKDAKDLDVKKLTGLLPAMQGAAGGVQIPSNLNLTKEDWFKIREQDRNSQLILTILPLVLGSQQGGMPPQFMDLMMRSFYENMVDSTAQRKALTMSMMRKLGTNLSDIPLGAMQPVQDALNKPAVAPGQATPIGTPT